MTTYINVRVYKGALSLKVLEPRFGARVGNALNQWLSRAPEEGFDRVVLDIGAVEFMDSSGLGAMVGLWRKFRDSKEIAIVGVKPAVRDLLYMTRMDYVLPISVNVQDAPAFV
jgi:anti-sigma B factor antagonist